MTLSKPQYYVDFFIFLKMIIPRREIRSISSRAPIFFTHTLFELRNVYVSFKITLLGWSIFVLENVVYTYGMGWMGLSNIKSGFEFFFILRYIKLPSHVLKYVSKTYPHKFAVGFLILVKLEIRRQKFKNTR